MQAAPDVINEDMDKLQLQKRVEKLEQQVEEQKLLIKVQQQQIQDQQAYIAKISNQQSGVAQHTVAATSIKTQETQTETDIPEMRHEM